MCMYMYQYTYMYLYEKGMFIYIYIYICAFIHIYISIMQPCRHTQRELSSSLQTVYTSWILFLNISVYPTCVFQYKFIYIYIYKRERERNVIVSPYILYMFHIYQCSRQKEVCSDSELGRQSCLESQSCYRGCMSLNWLHPRGVAVSTSTKYWSIVLVVAAVLSATHESLNMK